MRIGRNRSRAASIAASRRLDAPVPHLVGELHDQDRVLGREPHHRDQPDLEVDVARQSRGARCRAARRARRTARRSSTANGIDQLSYCAASTRKTMTRPSPKTRPAWPLGGALLERLARVADAHALRLELLGDAADRSPSCTSPRAPARLGRAGEERGGEAVEPEQLGRAAPELGAHERRRPGSSRRRGRARRAGRCPPASGGTAAAPRPAPGRSGRRG